MLKRLLSIWLLLVFLIPSFIKIGVFVDFKINQEFIIEFFCINKGEPELMCNGKCYLTKQLEETESPQNQDIPYQIKQEIEITLFLDRFEITIDPKLTEESNPHCFVELVSPYSSPYINGIFWPPDRTILS